MAHYQTSNKRSMPCTPDMEMTTPKRPKTKEFDECAIRNTPKRHFKVESFDIAYCSENTLKKRVIEITFYQLTEKLHANSFSKIDPIIKQGQEVWLQIRKHGWKCLKNRRDPLGDFVFVAPGVKRCSAIENVTKYTGYEALARTYTSDGEALGPMMARAEEASQLIDEHAERTKGRECSADRAVVIGPDMPVGNDVEVEEAATHVTESVDCSHDCDASVTSTSDDDERDEGKQRERGRGVLIESALMNVNVNLDKTVFSREDTSSNVIDSDSSVAREPGTCVDVEESSTAVPVPPSVTIRDKPSDFLIDASCESVNVNLDEIVFDREESYGNDVESDSSIGEESNRDEDDADSCSTAMCISSSPRINMLVQDYRRLKTCLDKAKESDDGFDIRFYSAVLSRFINEVENDAQCAR